MSVFRFFRGAMRHLYHCLAILCFFTVAASAQRFVNIADSVGLALTRIGAGIAIADADQDGLPDLFLHNGQNALPAQENDLLRNVGNGMFLRVAPASDLDVITGVFSGAAWGDIDNDGLPDLFVASGDYANGNALYHNRGGWRFTPITGTSGILGPALAQGAAWFDYNNDGYLDLFVTSQGRNGFSLYRNNGDGTFLEEGRRNGILSERSAVGPLVFDMDNDGDLDIYVINRTPGEANELYRNNGNGTFTEVAASAGVTGPRAVKSSGIAADLNNDGWIDLALTSDAGIQLLRNNSGGGFTDATAASGLRRAHGRSVTAGDVDNDGDIDLFMPDLASQALYVNRGNGVFVEQSLGGARDSSRSIAACWIDADADGDLDLYVIRQGEANRFYQNTGSAGNWLRVRMRGTRSNRQGIGARVSIYSGGRRQVREIVPSAGMSEMMMDGHVGLGTRTRVDSILVHWPTGTIQRLRSIGCNQTLEIVEPTAAVSAAGSTRRLSVQSMDVAPGDTIHLPILLMPGAEAAGGRIEIALPANGVTLKNIERGDGLPATALFRWTLRGRSSVRISFVGTLLTQNQPQSVIAVLTCIINRTWKPSGASNVSITAAQICDKQGVDVPVTFESGKLRKR